MIIWSTGLSGSGKSTLCDALTKLLKPSIPELVLLDGDVVREAFGGDLGYREQDRVIQIKRLQALAQALSKQNLVVLVAALYSHPDLLVWNRKNMSLYFEVYLDAPLELVQKRDPKGLYAKAAAGQMTDVVGLDIPWHEPVSPDLRIDMTVEADPDTHARTIIENCPGLKRRLEGKQIE
ncbi:MAG: adenylyl-sulfate kinase [Pseudomonadota bacterium]|nr:adenylyl-sulfate kinase [Pseudomonadota bacterium]